MGCAGARGSHNVRGMWQPALRDPLSKPMAPHATAEPGAWFGPGSHGAPAAGLALRPTEAGDEALRQAFPACLETGPRQQAQHPASCENAAVRHPGIAAPLPTAHEFLDCTGSDFSLAHPTGGHLATLRLIRVLTWHTGVLQGCSLHFTGPHIGRPAHDTYVLWHKQLGGLSLFLGPVQAAQAQSECLYEAVITHLNSPLDTGARHE